MNISAITSSLPLGGRPDITAAVTPPAAGALSADGKKIADSTQAFEAILVRQVLTEAFHPSTTNAGHPTEMYQSFLVDALAERISQSGALGLSTMLQSHLRSTPQSATLPHVPTRPTR